MTGQNDPVGDPIRNGGYPTARAIGSERRLVGDKIMIRAIESVKDDD
jgi:hypothetical protein